MTDANDIFAADILYHKKCYSSYLTQIRKKRYSQEETKVLNERKECEKFVMKRFLKLFREKVLIDRNAYLMTELIQDIHKVSVENGLQDAIIKHNHLLKKRFVEKFENSVGFYLVGKKQIVHCSEVNPCKYPVATLEGTGMRDDDICLSFARMIRRHIEKSTGRRPLSFSKLINNLKSNQLLQPLLNTIAWTLKPKAGMTSFGYVNDETKFLADRIWSISSDRESLIKKENSLKAIAPSMTVNRITGSKEVAYYINVGMGFLMLIFVIVSSLKTSFSSFSFKCKNSQSYFGMFRNCSINARR